MTDVRFLIVDDTKDIADTLSKLLTLLGHNCRVAYNSPHAVALAALFRPEIVLIDLTMPGESGFDLFRQLRNAPATRGSFLVAHSGYDDAEHRKMVDDAGFDHFLLKPVSTDGFQRVIELARDRRSESA